MGTPRSVDVVVGRSVRGEVFSSFKSANGRTVRVLDQGVYRKASAAAGKALRDEIREIREKAGAGVERIRDRAGVVMHVPGAPAPRGPGKK
jgi:hypothetical protein